MTYGLRASVLDIFWWGQKDIDPSMDERGGLDQRIARARSASKEVVRR